MSAEPLTPEISDRICAHMNDDHAEAILLYAQIFAQAPNATSARMVSIDPEGMNLTALVEEKSTPLHVSFERKLENSEDAHHTLIEMAKQARKMSQEVG
jgi:putative heme iron utilization protein